MVVVSEGITGLPFPGSPRGEAAGKGREGERGEGRKQAEEGSESDRAGVAAWVLGD